MPANNTFDALNARDIALQNSPYASSNIPDALNDVPEAKMHPASVKDQYSDMSALQREAFVFGGAAKDSLENAVRDPRTLLGMAGGAGASLGLAAIQGRARPLALALEVAGIGSAATLAYDGLNTYDQAQTIWKRTWSGDAHLQSDREAARAITDNLTNLAAFSAGAAVGPLARAYQFKGEWKALDDITFYGKRPAVPIDSVTAATFRRTHPAVGMVVRTTGEQGQFKLNSSSGFVLDPEGTFLTTNHGVKGATTIDIVLPGRGTYGTTLLASDEKLDMALLKLTKKNSTENFPYVRVVEAQPAAGEPIMAIGYPGDREVPKLQMSMGKYNKLRLDHGLEQDGFFLHTMPGFSGGPLVNKYGRAISMTKAGGSTSLEEASRVHADGSQYTLGVPGKDLSAFVRNNIGRSGTLLKQFESTK